MAELVITDKIRAYKRSKTNFKLLLDDIFWNPIKHCSFLGKTEITSLNDAFYIKRIDAGESILSELKAEANLISVGEDRCYDAMDLVHHFLKPSLERKYFLEVLINLLVPYIGNLKSVKLHLSGVFYPLSEFKLGSIVFDCKFYKDRKILIQSVIQRIKNQLYRRKENHYKKGKKNIAFVLQTAPHHHSILKKVYQLISIKDVNISIVVYPLYLGEMETFKEHIPKEASMYYIMDFSDKVRGRYKFEEIKKKKYKSILQYAPTNQIRQGYVQFENMIARLKPDLCVTIGYFELNRLVINSCKRAQIPTANIDYGIISDDYRFDNHLFFTKRFVISEEQKKIWKRRNDQSDIEVVGFLKHDFLEKDVWSILKKSKKKKVFFASSTGIPENKKVIIFKKLKECCLQNGWELIVKLHPLELFDSVIHEVKSFGKVYRHDQISIFECIEWSDVVITSGSSVIIDALLLEKPYVEILFGEEISLTDFMPFSENDFWYKILISNSFSNDLLRILTESESIFFQRKMAEARRKYLGMSDGKASNRVVTSLMKMIE